MKRDERARCKSPLLVSCLSSSAPSRAGSTFPALPLAAASAVPRIALVALQEPRQLHLCRENNFIEGYPSLGHKQGHKGSEQEADLSLACQSEEPIRLNWHPEVVFFPSRIQKHGSVR